MNEPSWRPLHIGSKQIIFKNNYKSFYKVTATFAEGTKEYYVTDGGERSGLFVIQGENVLLVRQYRLLINQLSWEIPGGSLDEGETAEAAAIRECFEETGIRCRNLKPLLSYHLGLDTLLNPTHLFYTHEFTEEGKTLAAFHEIQQREWIPLSRCLEMITDKEIVDSLTIIAILSYQTWVGRS